jgi:hypothetical protein
MAEQYANMRSATPPSDPAQTGPLPRINVPADIALSEQERMLLQHVHRGCEEVLVEKEFSGGYSDARVLLTLPSVESGATARKVTKLGPTLEMRKEWENYKKCVEPFLPFSAARVEGYYEQNDQAGLNHVYVGGGALGEVVDLREYYRTHTAKQVIEMLDVLLDRALGEAWYGEGDTVRPRRFAAEYGHHMVAHLQLKLRRASSDTFWPAGQPPGETPKYQQMAADAILPEHGSTQPGTLLSVEGLAVKQIKRGAVELQDPNRPDVLVRVEFLPGDDRTQGLEPGNKVGVRGKVIHNRHERMEEIVCDIFPDLSPHIGNERIELPDVPGMYPNPLRTYPDVLNKTLRGRASYVHGDLHLLNVLVNVLPTGLGRGWLIDFAEVQKRHSIFDFIKLETYLRLSELGSISPPLPPAEYARFEEALNATTLGLSATPPTDPDLQKAYQVILSIRNIARNYMGPHPDFRNEYFPALFLYCLAVMKYHENDGAPAARWVFTTACVLGRDILENDGPPPLPPPPPCPWWLLALLLLDSCFATVCGWCLLRDQPNLVAYLGTVLTFVSMLVAILTPVFVANRRISLEDVLRRLGTDRRYTYIILGLTVLIVPITFLFWPLGRVGKCRLTPTPIFTSTPTLTETATLTPTDMPSLTPATYPPTTMASPTETETATATATATSIPTPTPPPSIEITSPLTQVVCPLNDKCRYDVMGTSLGVANNPNLEVVIFVIDGELWQPFRTFVQSGGSWQDSAQIGDEPCWPAGYRFEIVAVVMSREQADSLEVGFQMLPGQYIARSDSVHLVTAYDESVPVNLSSEVVLSHDGSPTSIITLTETGPSHLVFDYDLRSGEEVQARVTVNKDWSCVKNTGYSLAFSLEGTGNANTLEIRLEDQHGTHVSQIRSQASLTQGPVRIDLPLSEFSHWWPPDSTDDMDWVQVKNLYFAISRGAGGGGGSGRVAIRDVALVPLAPPEQN